MIVTSFFFISDFNSFFDADGNRIQKGPARLVHNAPGIRNSQVFAFRCTPRKRRGLPSNTAAKGRAAKADPGLCPAATHSPAAEIRAQDRVPNRSHTSRPPFAVPAARLLGRPRTVFCIIFLLSHSVNGFIDFFRSSLFFTKSAGSFCIPALFVLLFVKDATAFPL
jgi:hypothetical protein